jgi:hypothetical protein
MPFHRAFLPDESLARSGGDTSKNEVFRFIDTTLMYDVWQQSCGCLNPPILPFPGGRGGGILPTFTY